MNKHKLEEDKVKCPHEDNIEYGALEQIDGEPLYNVTCNTCGAKGVIHLVEDKEEWEQEVIIKIPKENKDERFCHLCGAKEIKGGWCTNESCAEYRKYKTTNNKKIIKEIDKFLIELDEAENEDWFEWMQDAAEILSKAKDVIKQYETTKLH